MPRPWRSYVGQARFRKGLEGDGSVRDEMLRGGVHLGEGDGVAVRHEYRIVAEAHCAARRKGEMAEHLAFVELHVASRRCEAEHANEIGAWRCGERTLLSQRGFHPGDRRRK